MIAKKNKNNHKQAESFETAQIKLIDIIAEVDLQSRAGLDQKCINDYTDDIKIGDDFPSVDVFFDGTYYFLTDGFHRYEAHKAAGKDSISANVHQGTRRDAILHSVGVNSQHGLRRTNADKKKAVEKLLLDNQWSEWSDGEIAKQCAVSQPFVSKIRRELTQNGSESPTERKGADGRTINTAPIGKNKDETKEQEPSPDEEAEASEKENQTDAEEEDQMETVKVGIDLPETTETSEGEKSSKSTPPGKKTDSNGDDEPELSVEELLSDLRTHINELSSELTELKNILSQKGDISKDRRKQIEDLSEKLNAVWTDFITSLDDLIDK